MLIYESCNSRLVRSYNNNNNNNNCAAVLTLKACIPRQPGTLPVIVIAAPQVGFSIHEAPRRTTRGRAERRRASAR